MRGNTPGGEVLGQDITGRRGVDGCAQAKVCKRGITIDGSGIIRLNRERENDPEGATLPDLAFDTDGSPHQCAELFADTQTKARSAVNASRGSVYLRKGLKELGLAFRTDTGTGIDDGEFDSGRLRHT